MLEMVAIGVMVGDDDDEAARASASSSSTLPSLGWLERPSVHFSETRADINTSRLTQRSTEQHYDDKSVTSLQGHHIRRSGNYV